MRFLNESQKEAVHCPDRHVLIVAGPGTGKTHTLTQRIARAASSFPEGSHFLAITFTQRAAEEMRTRLDQLGINADQHNFIGTFHQLCFKVLKEEGENFLARNRAWGIATEDQIKIFTRELWPEKNQRERYEALRRISDWKTRRFDQPPDQEAAAYDEALRARDIMDFDDLLLQAFKLLRRSASFLERIRAQFRWIFVDEYQDINRIQYELIRALLGPEGYLTAIGDPHQAIYGFRGADSRYFSEFSRDFPKAKVITLTENYRSAQNILDASFQVICSDCEGTPEGLALTAQIYREGRLIVHDCSSEKAEAEYVAHQIEKLVGGVSMFSQDSGRVGPNEEGLFSFGEIAVLYRLHGQAHAVAKAFERLGIPYEKSGLHSAEEGVDSGICLGQQTEEPRIDPEKVSLLTLHAVKGLEFPVVFIIGCEQGLLPLDVVEIRSDPKEEKRLFYVGMTRAQRQLYLLRACRRSLFGKIYKNPESPFLRDIEAQLKQMETERVVGKKKQQDPQMELFQALGPLRPKK